MGILKAVSIRRSILIALLLLLPLLGSAQVEVLSGNLKNYLENIPIPPADSSDKYAPPTPTDLARMRTTVRHVLAGRVQSAATEAALINYRLIVFQDTLKSKYHILLIEKADANTWRGTYAFALSPTRNLVIESPHPLFDGTQVQAIDLYVETGSIAFMQSGTHRNNSSEEAPCDGTQTSGDPYYISDMAHVVDSFYQVIHEELHLGRAGVICLSVHGMATNPQRPSIILSNGTSGPAPTTSLSRRLSTHMNQILANAGDDRTVRSWQDPNNSGLTLSGSTNTQGRFSNGSPSPCFINVGTAPQPERFIHMEQVSAVRSGSRSNWAFVTQTFNEVIDEAPLPTATTPGTLTTIANWPLNGSGTETVSGRNATTVGTATIAAPNRHTHTGQALLFPGIDTALTVNDFPYQSTAYEFSIIAWFQSTQGPNNFQYLYSHGTVGTNNDVNIPASLHLYLANSNGQLRSRFTTADGRHWSLDGPTGLLDGAWHQLIFTWSFRSGAALYLNGQAVGADPDHKDSHYDPEGPITWGARSDLSVGRFFGSQNGTDGRMDDLRFLNTALGPDEVLALFQEESNNPRPATWIIK